MPAPRSRRRARISALLTAALALTGAQVLLTAPAAQAASADLVITEVYGAGGNAGATFNADFVELRNLGAAAVTLDGKSIQYRSATGTSAQVMALSGVLPAGQRFLAQLSAPGANGAALPTPNQVASPAIGMSGTSGVVVLANSTTPFATQGSIVNNAAVIDLVGFGSAATTFEAAATGVDLSPTTSAQRADGAADTDNNATDFSELTPAPTAGVLALAVTDPGVKRFVVNQPITGFNLAASGGTTPYTFTATGLPDGVQVAPSGAVTGTPTTVGTSVVEVTVTDSATPTPATHTRSFTLKVNPAAGATNTIAEVQGTGDETPLYGQDVTTQGVVTASYPEGGLNGFYIQTPGADTANASDAVFVFAGANFTPYPAVGDSVKVAGEATEFNGLTEIVDPVVTPVTPSLGTVTPKTQVPGTNCGVGACLDTARLNTAREAVEGEAFKPTAPWTLTDVYDGGPYYTGGTNSSAFSGELGVAADRSQPLVAPTENVDAQNVAARNARTAYNDAHRIILDDGSTVNYTTTTGSAFPWLTKTHAPRVGAAVTFPEPVVFTWGFNAWRVLPSTRVVGAPTATQPQIAQTRAANAAPAAVPGDVKLATFNVLNFFPTTGEEYVTSGLGTCTYFNDRSGAPVTVNSCTNNGPRGAADAANLARQRAKVVAAINTADADVVSLEELENSVKFGKARDFAIGELVTALNADAGPGTWAFAPSPATLPPLAQQDVIRTGFIYQPARVALVGESVVLSDQSDDATNEPFADAREPLAQAFKKVGQPDTRAFAVIVNHFKSKGSGTPDPNGQGNANDRRILQAQSLVDFAQAFQAERGIDKTFLVGDFNAYSQEDPIQVLEAAGFTNLESTTAPGEKSYNFDGQIGSLDHVLANGAAHQSVRGVDVWPINSYESVYYEYSRFNYNVTDLYEATPFRSSDHNPEIVGFSTAEPTTRDIQILGTNDFHGRLQNDATAATAGAAVLAGAVKQLRGQNPDTVFAAAGDLIGASTFESFIAKDKPAIDVLNEAGLEVSSVGNHEFDQGYDDLVNRVMKEYDADTNPYGGAGWDYIADNVRFKANNRRALAPSWTKTFGNVEVGFIGAVTEHLPELVSPSGIAQIKVTDVVAETNDVADDLKRDGADIVVLLVHEGAPTTDCATMDDDPTSDFGSIVTGVSENVDAIISGHTHLAYNCSFPVAAWAGDADHPVKERPVVSAGQYGMALNQLVFSVDTTTGQVTAKAQALLNLKTCAAAACGGSGQPPWVAQYPTDPATQEIVEEAVASADVLGAAPLGKINGAFSRAKVADGTTENRGGESTLGNLVAEAQKQATTDPAFGAAQIAFMNPGGLRADMPGDGSGPYPRTLTYKQAATVQPFANTLVNMKLTGAQLKTVLEQQWQPAGASRPFLRLGVSKGFTYTYDPDAAAGSRILSMRLNGAPVVAGTSYSVTVNSFLSSGGDNFSELANGTQKQDTGRTDLQGMVDYMAQFATTPLAVDATQRAVGVNFPAGAPATYRPGDRVKFDVSSWSMSTAADVKDTVVNVGIGGTALGTATLDNTPPAAAGFDDTGKAAVDVVLPAGTAGGTVDLTLTGATTGTSITVPITVQASPPSKGASTIAATTDPAKPRVGQKVELDVSVSGPNGVAATGEVRIKVKGEKAVVAQLVNGKVTVNLGKFRKQGKKKVTIDYLGSTTLLASTETVTFKVRKKG